MFRLELVLALCTYGALALYHMDYELEDLDKLWSRRGVPGTATSSEGSGVAACKKDILILWDNSFSIGKSDFINRIKPFIMKLISSTQLNVGPDGTHIGIITFSTEAETRVLVGLGEMQTTKQLLSYLKNLTWDEVDGDGTRTGMALKMADELFTKDSPGNHRPDVGDVVMIFTDGEPVRRKGEAWFGVGNQYEGNEGEKRLASDRAASLKEKDVLIVGLAVGSESQLEEFRPDILSWSTSEKYFFEAKLDKLDSVLGSLIGKACIDPGQCGCDKITTETYTAQGQKALISWPEPTLRCASNRKPNVNSKVVEPDISSPAEFGIGKHTITYKYSYQRGPKIVHQTCFVEIVVRACQCSENETVTARLPSGESMAWVTWTVPTPNCPATLTSASLPSAGNGRGHYPIGEHSARYNYEYREATRSFTLSCSVNIVVKGTLCGGVGFSPKQVCCCGTVHDIMRNHKCCGPEYIDLRYKKCEDFYTVVDL